MQGATDMASVGWACERRDTSLRRKLQLAVRRKVRQEKVWVAKRRKHVSSWGVIAACHEAALLLPAAAAAAAAAGCAGGMRSVDSGCDSDICFSSVL